MGDERLMTKAEIKELIRDTVREAVPDALERVGFDTSRPMETQRDLAFLRDLRGANDSVKRHGLFVVIGILLSAAASLVWIGLRSKIGGGAP